MMKLSFTLGRDPPEPGADSGRPSVTIPTCASLNKLGWALFIWGMFGVVNMFVLQGADGLADALALPADRRCRRWPSCLPAPAAIP